MNNIIKASFLENDVFSEISKTELDSIDVSDYILHQIKEELDLKDHKFFKEEISHIAEDVKDNNVAKALLINALKTGNYVNDFYNISDIFYKQTFEEGVVNIVKRIQNEEEVALEKEKQEAVDNYTFLSTISEIIDLHKKTWEGLNKVDELFEKAQISPDAVEGMLYQNLLFTVQNNVKTPGKFNNTKFEK